jgi:hypothetical protein
MLNHAPWNLSLATMTLFHFQPDSRFRSAGKMCIAAEAVCDGMNPFVAAEQQAHG